MSKQDKQDSKITDQINASIAKAFAILSEDFKQMVDNAKAELLKELPSLVTSEVQSVFSNTVPPCNLQEFSTNFTRISEIVEVVHAEKFNKIAATLHDHQVNIANSKHNFELASQFNAPPLSDVMINLTSVLKEFLGLTKDLHRTNARLYETAVNKVSPPEDDSFSTVLTTYLKHKIYRRNGGSLSFRELLSQAPEIIELIVKRAQLRDPTYEFPDISIMDDNFLSHLIEKVYYPTGFSISAFRILINTKPLLGKFTLQKAAAYGLHVHTIITTIIQKLLLHQIDSCWQVVIKGVIDDHKFQNSLRNQDPTSYDQFWSIIDDRARIFSESDSSTDHQDQQKFALSPSSPSYNNRFSNTSNQYGSPLRQGKINHVSLGDKRDSQDHEDHVFLERRDQTSPGKMNQTSSGRRDHKKTVTLHCSKCRQSGHTADSFTVLFCRDCYNHGISFLHNEQQCPLPNNYGVFDGSLLSGSEDDD